MGIEGESGDSNAASVGESLLATVHVRCTNGSKFSVQVALNTTVSAFKALLAEKSDVPTQQQRLIYKGRILKDEQTLESYGMESDHTVHMVCGSVPSTTSTNTSANLGTSATETLRDASSTDGGGFSGVGSASPLIPGLGANGLFGTGASGFAGSWFPEFDQVQQQLTQNPNVMRDILNMPAIQNLMNNPDLVRNLIMNNPQMREILDRNPDLAHVLNDPSTLRQTLEAARNPELMREMMRNTDRAMSNIESSPEGFNMLRRMYETVQEPFLNATTMAGNTGGDDSNPFAALLGNQGNVQTRDRSTNRSDVENGSLPNSNPLPNPWSNAAGPTTTNTRSTPASEARSDLFGGLSVPELDAGGILDPSALSQMLQNPATAQMMQSILSNPQYVNQIFNMNPQLRSMMESNTQLREMVQNPEFLRQLASPEALQQALSLQQSLFTLFGQQPSNQGRNQSNGATGMEHLMQMFGGLGAGGNFGIPSNPDVPPEELYATQLSQLQEMGFFDTQENIRALIATAGNVHAAVERLLGSLGH
ncbi:ubiquitin domain-containing protein DSK2b-like isoform X2 [Phalaenopsis equestris]|uniref:ubiquitin domain-containing protein DSK2b-like isoform X2 n=1 Tax=Phalaenopsis equestris TaxID=78828 RepID=UPI0009E42EF2|nr:ubiquitin domain-containing protein DSK2b-like isoform X2 [Phalaenopsis equestris]